MSKTIRCCRTAALVVAAILVVTAGTAFGATTGIAITKSCPGTVLQGETFTCDYTVQNLNPTVTLTNLAVTNMVPFPGGTAVAVNCNQPDASGGNVTTLGTFGSPTDTCFGSVSETAPIDCTNNDPNTPVYYTDQISATGNQGAGPVSSATTNSPQVLPVVCDDGLFCTDDSCDATIPISDPLDPAASLCVHVAHSCNDGLACTTDSCDETLKACVNAPVVCTDGNACNGLEVCNTTTGACDAGTAVVCGDGDVCNGTEVCNTATGACDAGTPLSCDDSNACNGLETCDSTSGCVAGTPLSCDNGNFCDGTETCDSTSGCVAGTAPCGNCEICNEGTDACDPDPACVTAPGRMTGGGSIFTKAGGRVTHGFTLHCDPLIGPNNLEINFSGNHCHLTELISASCTDDPAIAPRPPSADFDTFVGSGTMTCNGDTSCTIDFTLTDAGEPGKYDTATYSISCPTSGLTLNATGSLTKGNQQAHKN